jgi:RNA polymerase sigma factor (sigma-70 family)
MTIAEQRQAAPMTGLGEAAPATPEGFADWVRPHMGAMSRLAARLAPGADRDDVVQEALARAWSKRHQHDPARGALSSWLLAITADQAAKARRRAWRPRVAMPQGRAPDTDARLDVVRALSHLTARQRQAVDCVYFVGLTVVETAAVMGCAEGTVKSTLSDARSRLRKLLEVAG